MTYLEVFFPSSYSVERKQSALSGRAKRRAENIINLPYEAKIINHLVTTERLKEYGFLSDAVGDICSYQDFYGGRPIKRKAKAVEEVEIEEEESDEADDLGAPDYGYTSLIILLACSFIVHTSYCYVKHANICILFYLAICHFSHVLLYFQICRSPQDLA